MGSDFRLDVNELQRRLHALPSRKASPYLRTEWGGSEDTVFQVGNPTPAVSVIDLISPVKRDKGSIEIASNTATQSVTVHLGGDHAGVLGVVKKNDTRWTATLPPLSPSQNYVLTITAYGADGQQPTVIARNFISSQYRSAIEIATLKASRAKPEDVSDEEDGGLGSLFNE